MRKVNNFDDWIDYFRYWQDSIGISEKEMAGTPFRKVGFDAKFGEPEAEAIEFGHYKGQTKWPTIMHIPDQRIRDALLNLIVFQGDTEFASVEQQRQLLERAPSDYYLLCTHFGDEGKREAQKLLDRRAEEGERLLGSFNEIVENWLDFFTYTQFIDRDGKFQLQMLSTSSFHPLARSMGPMLKEESFHLGTGNNGLRRILKAGRVPTEVVQRYFNKWVPTAFDLFGTDNSSSAHWAYVWGLKGRFDERETQDEANLAHLNEASRELYRQEITRLVDRLNTAIPDPEQHLRVPDSKFNRKIGLYARQHFTITGEPVDAAKYPAYLASVMPNDADRTLLKDLLDEPDWIELRKLEENN